jgi:hypothetical protein
MILGGVTSVWVSAIVGLICIMLSWNFAKWLVTTLSGQTYNTGVNWIDGPNAGQPVGYFELATGWGYTEMGMFLLGVALVVEAAVLFVYLKGLTASRWPVVVCLVLSGFALLTNLTVCGYVLFLGLMPIYSLMAVLVAGMIFFERKAMLR